MGTITSSATTVVTDETLPAEARLEHVTLDRIRVREGFNPRTTRDPKCQQRLERSIQRAGVLVPIELAPDPERPDGFLLVAGEGRLIAAMALGLQRMPAAIHQVGLQSGGLEHAAIENLHRENLDAVDEARLCQRLIDSGLTVKAVAERLSHPQTWVRDRIAILTIPENLHDEVNEGRVPLKAIKALAKLAEIHPDLANRAVAATRVEQEWRRIGWDELTSDPIHAAMRDPGELPDGLYATTSSHSVEQFDLDEQAVKQLEELCREHLGGMHPDAFAVRFDDEAAQNAARLNAVHLSADATHGVIVGKDVASQIAGDYITRCLQAQREHHEAHKNDEAIKSGKDNVAGPKTVDPSTGNEDRRKAEREQRDVERVSAVAHNEELGAVLVKHLSQVQVSENVIRVLTAFDLAGNLDRIAARGARYCLPGWPTTTTIKGKTKTSYPEPHQAGTKAREYLQGAASESGLAGRILVLLAGARLADERCVAQSSRTHMELRSGGQSPWSNEALWLLDELVAKALPKAKADRFLKPRRDELAAARANAKEKAAAEKRLEKALKDSARLSESEREEALADLAVVHSRWSSEYRRIEQTISEQNTKTAAA